MSGEDTHIIIAETILDTRPKAIEIMYHGERYWLPISQLFGFDGCAIGDTDIELEASQWILEEKGII